jgi:hypothetical protein
MHGFLKNSRRLEGLVGFHFHDVQLHFFPKSETGQLYKVHDSAAVALYDFVCDWQGRKFLVDEGKFVFWT